MLWLYFKLSIFLKIFRLRFIRHLVTYFSYYIYCFLHFKLAQTDLRDSTQFLNREFLYFVTFWTVDTHSTISMADNYSFLTRTITADMQHGCIIIKPHSLHGIYLFPCSTLHSLVLSTAIMTEQSSWVRV